MEQRSIGDLEAGLALIRESPTAEGRVELIVRRPAAGEREVLQDGVLEPSGGLLGDAWLSRGSKRMADGSADREAQLTIMNSRVAELLAGAPEDWAMAGDQLYVDLDLGVANLPPGTRLRVGTAVVEVSAILHTGCAQFSARFGVDALRFVSTPEGREMRLRGVNTTILEAGTVRTGDVIRKW
jgi:hypothetical protein